MEIQINFIGTVSEKESLDSDRMRQAIEEECMVTVQVDRVAGKAGVKDSGLIIGLTVASLAVASLQTFIAILSYWSSMKPTYSISILIEDTEIYIDNLNSDKLEKTVSNIKYQDNLNVIRVKISKK